MKKKQVILLSLALIIIASSIIYNSISPGTKLTNSNFTTLYSSVPGEAQGKIPLYYNLDDPKTIYINDDGKYKEVTING